MTLGEFTALYPKSEVMFVGVVDPVDIMGEYEEARETEACDTPEQAINNANGLVLIHKLQAFDPLVYVKAILIWSDEK